MVVNTSSRGTSHDSSGSNDSTAVYSCDSLLVKAARDFRLQVPLLPGRRFGVRWEIALVFPSTSHVKDQTLGFSILRQRSDGYLPQVEPYKVYSASGGQGFVEIECDESITEESPTKDVTLVFLFDNTFSWYRQKRVRYKIEVFELEDEPADDIPDSTSLAAASQDSLENTLKQLDASDLLSDDISPYTSFNHIGQINDADLGITNSHELVEWVRRVLVFSAESSICDRKNY